MVNIMNQAKLVFKRNLILVYRTKDYIRQMILPLAAISFSLLAYFIDTPQGQNPFSGLSIMFVPLTLLGYLRSFLYSYVNEKYERFKEVQKIMGLKQTSYTLGWLFSNLTQTTLICSLYLLITVSASVFSTVEAGIGFVIGLYLMYMLASLAQTYFFCSVFQYPKFGSDMLTLIQLISSILFNLLLVDSVRDSAPLLCLMAIFPQFALQAGLARQGWDGTKQRNPAYMKAQFPASTALIMMTVDTLLYSLLFLYMEEVMPNEYGTQKSPLFFLKLCKKKSPQQVQYESQMAQMINAENAQQPLLSDQESHQPVSSHRMSVAQEDVSSAKFHEKQDTQNLRKTVKVRGLVKTYGTQTVIQNISFTLYEGKIFCMLGHNGAGKTTTISMMTGLISKNFGKVHIYDMDLDEDKDVIRTSMGLCNQKDVLYDNLTVEEHLRFTAEVKGVDPSQIMQEMDQLITTCNLQTERHKITKILSGGNKRKLSLAMALIGGSKIVFLDEPSSGLDPVTRRLIWDILMQVKQSKRTIVLTTHHLEEAEYLADTICIMAKGTLLTQGSSDFIKKNFGIGYHLHLSARKAQQQMSVDQAGQQNSDYSQTYSMSAEQIEAYKQFIFNSIPAAKLNSQSPKGQLWITVPFSEREKLIPIFQKIEREQDVEVNLEMNSLEDAFVNIGMDESKFLQQDSLTAAEPGTAPQDIQIPINAQGNANQVQQENYTDFSQIQTPPSLSYPPTYKFMAQLKSIFQRKIYITIRSIQVVVSFILPVLFQFMGGASAGIVIKQLPPEQVEYKEYIIYACVVSNAMLANCLSSSTFCGTVVLEREKNLKYALNVMGCRILPYWLGTFLFDYIVFFLQYIVFLLICLCFNFTCIVDELGNLSLVFIPFGIAFIGANYLFSHMFEKSATAYKWIIWINYFLLFLVGVILYYLTDLIHQDSLQQTLKVIIICIIPMQTFYFGFFNAGTSHFPNHKGTAHLYTPIDQQWIYALIILLQAIVLYSLAVLLDYKQYDLSKQQTGEGAALSERLSTDYADEDVKQDELRINHPSCKDTVKVCRLYKTYETGTHALTNVNFSSKESEIFGLLGPNGAGKSTSFNILTSLIPRSAGSVQMKGLEVNKGIMDIYQYVGICAQFDALWDNLSVFEHLRLFGSMKGLEGPQLEQQINYFLQVMQLTPYANKKSIQLSGGNKRKLCVSLALIGGPDMQFFDEPSTGVDPIARRFLWNTLNQSLKLRNSSIVLTTHSMHEAESLCTKIGILVNGKFRCVGSPQYLKQKYGQGYMIQLYIDQQQEAAVVQETINQVVTAFQQQFPDSVLQPDDHQEGKLLFKMPYEKFSFYQTFNFLQNQLLKEKRLIKDFQICQSSLEQIFMYFSSFQKQVDANKLKLTQ